MTVTLRAPDPVAFAPFGAFLPPPTSVGARAQFGGWLEPVPGRSQRCHLNRVAPTSLPATVEQVERHPHAAQLFLPLGEVSRYVVTVMPADRSGAPDPDGALAFVVPGGTGVVYRPGTWHAPITVLDAESTFAVLMWRGGEDDDVFASVRPIELRAAAAVESAHG